MINIARVISFFSGQYGGPAMHIKELIKFLKPYPIKNTIYASSNIDYSGKLRTISYQKINPRFDIKRFQSFIRFRDYRFSHGLFKSLLKDINNIDIIHSHSPRSYQEDIAALVAVLKKRSKRFVITSHGAISLSLSYFQHLYERLKDSTIGALEKRLMNINYIAVTKLELEFLKRHQISEDRLHYIPYGIDINHFKPVDPKEFIQKYGLESNQTILYVGRLFKEKKIDVLLNAFALMKDDYPNAKVVLAGGDFGYKTTLEQLSKKLGIEKQVVFLGHVDKPDLPKIYSLANILVSPAKSETLGLTVLEANACETPAIASNHWGPRETIINGKNGFLIDFGKINQMRDRIVEVLDNESLQKKMGKFARDHMIQNFSWEQNAKSHYRLYKKILE